MSVEERKSHLFGKFSSQLSAQDKEVKWQEVADAVTSMCGVLRTADAVKKKWSTITSEAKKRGALVKKDQGKTGGGQPEVKPLTALEERILAVMGKVYTEGRLHGYKLTLAS